MINASKNPNKPQPVVVELIDPPTKGSKVTRASEEKWSSPVMKRGHTIIPSLLLKGQAVLGLTPELLNVLLQLIEHWWEPAKNPYPTKTTIANRIGKSPRQVQRYLTDLEGMKLVQRIQRFKGVKAQTSNEYSLGGLVAALKKIEPDFRRVAEKNRNNKKKAEMKKAESK